MMEVRSRSQHAAGWLVLLVVMLGTLIAIEAVGRRFEDAFAGRVVDIQHEGQLLPKLRHLCRFDGFKVVVIGDSLIYGRTLRDHGDDDWRTHTLPACLERRLRAVHPDRDVLVMNLGINGALPGDYEQLFRLITACDVDLIVLDIHLRPFSRDFQAPSARLARPWLAEITPERIHPDRVFTPPFRWRGLLQANLLHSDRMERGPDLRARLLGASTGAELVTDPDVLLLRLAERYRSVDLDEGNPQVTALRRGLGRLRRDGQNVLIFYAQENPEFRPALFSDARYRGLREKLEAIIGEYTGAALRYVRESGRLRPRHYLDVLHPDAEGLELLADDLIRAWMSAENPRAVQSSRRGRHGARTRLCYGSVRRAPPVNEGSSG